MVFVFSLSLTRFTNTLSYAYCSFCCLLWIAYLSFLPFLFWVVFCLTDFRSSLSGYDSFVGYMYNIPFLPLWGMPFQMVSFQYFLLSVLFVPTEMVFSSKVKVIQLYYLSQPFYFSFHIYICNPYCNLQNFTWISISLCLHFWHSSLN